MGIFNFINLFSDNSNLKLTVRAFFLLLYHPLHSKSTLTGSVFVSTSSFFSSNSNFCCFQSLFLSLNCCNCSNRFPALILKSWMASSASTSNSLECAGHCLYLRNLFWCLQCYWLMLTSQLTVQYQWFCFCGPVRDSCSFKRSSSAFLFGFPLPLFVLFNRFSMGGLSWSISRFCLVVLS